MHSFQSKDWENVRNQLCSMDTGTILLRVRGSRDTDTRIGTHGGGAVHPCCRCGPTGGRGRPQHLFLSRSPRIGTRLPRVPPARDPIDDVSAHTVLDARHALDTLPDGVVIADEDGVVRLVNDRAAVLLGTTREATEGRPLAEVVAVTNQEGAGWVACTRPYEGLVTRTGVPEQSWILPSGDEVLVTARIHRAPRH